MFLYISVTLITILIQLHSSLKCLWIPVLLRKQRKYYRKSPISGTEKRDLAIKINTTILNKIFVDFIY